MKRYLWVLPLALLCGGLAAIGPIMGRPLPKSCDKFCDLYTGNGDLTKTELACQQCCDTLGRGAECYNSCAAGRPPSGVDCKRRVVNGCGCRP